MFGIYGTKEAVLLLFFSPFCIEAHKIVALSFASFILFGLMIGFIGFDLALLDAKNDKKFLKIKNLKLDEL